MAAFAEDIPEYRRKLVRLKLQIHVLGPLEDEILRLTQRRDAGQVALDVGGEYRNAGAGKTLGQNLQRDRLAGTGRAGDEAMPVRERQRQEGCLFLLADEDRFLGVTARHAHTFCIQNRSQGSIYLNCSRMRDVRSAAATIDTRPNASLDGAQRD